VSCARVFHYWLEQWKENVYLVVGASSEELSKFCEEAFGVVWDGDANESWSGKALEITCSSSRDRTHVILMAIREFDLTPMLISCLAHECLHACEYILERAGIKHCNATSEVFAHTQETIFRLCLMDLMGDENPAGDVQRQEVTGMKREVTPTA